MRPDIRSLIHGIFNLILPFFAYDLAGLLSFALTVGDYTPWTAIWPMTILVALPFLSDLVGVVLGVVRYAKTGRTCALLGIIFSVGGAAGLSVGGATITGCVSLYSVFSTVKA